MSSVLLLACLVVALVLVIGCVLVLVRKRAFFWRISVPFFHRRGSTLPPAEQVTAGIRVAAGQLTGSQEALSQPVASAWYTRRRTLVSCGLLVMVFSALFLQSGLAGGTLTQLSTGLSVFIPSSLHSSTDPFSPFAHAQPAAGNQMNNTNSAEVPLQPLTGSASARLVRIDSTARNQYYTDYQWRVWSYSSCSGIAMEMVMNAYGRHLIAADVLQVEANLGVWSEQLGLLRNDGIALAAASFGFAANASTQRSVQDIIATANSGSPVIVDLRDNSYFPGGHFFVIRGGDSQYLYIADSSYANFQRMTHAMFMGMYQNYSVVLTPR